MNLEFFKLVSFICDLFRTTCLGLVQDQGQCFLLDAGRQEDTDLVAASSEFCSDECRVYFEIGENLS